MIISTNGHKAAVGKAEHAVMAAATHILKLNFVITSINAQTLKNFEPEQADMLTR